MKPYAEGDGWRIYCDRAEVVLARAGRGEFDLCLTDPPYGLDMAGGHRPWGMGRRCPKKTWDKTRPDAGVFHLMREASRHQIVWGGNYFADLLPPSRGWLVWHKKHYPNKTSFADCELAWTSLNQNARLYHHLWCGGAKAENEPRYLHPTQKPRRLFAWCLEIPKVRPASVIDPFMGSGTTLEVCIMAGIPVVGVDRDEEYCRMAAERAMMVEACVHGA